MNLDLPQIIADSCSISMQSHTRWQDFLWVMVCAQHRLCRFSPLAAGVHSWAGAECAWSCLVHRVHTWTIMQHAAATGFQQTLFIAEHHTIIEILLNFTQKSAQKAKSSRYDGGWHSRDSWWCHPLGWSSLPPSISLWTCSHVLGGKIRHSSMSKLAAKSTLVSICPKLLSSAVLQIQLPSTKILQKPY